MYQSKNEQYYALSKLIHIVAHTVVTHAPNWGKKKQLTGEEEESSTLVRHTSKPWKNLLFMRVAAAQQNETKNLELQIGLLIKIQVFAFYIKSDCQKYHSQFNLAIEIP